MWSCGMGRELTHGFSQSSGGIPDGDGGLSGLKRCRGSGEYYVKQRCDGPGNEADAGFDRVQRRRDFRGGAWGNPNRIREWRAGGSARQQRGSTDEGGQQNSNALWTEGRRLSTPPAAKTWKRLWQMPAYVQQIAAKLRLSFMRSVKSTQSSPRRRARCS